MTAGIKRARQFTSQSQLSAVLQPDGKWLAYVPASLYPHLLCLGEVVPGAAANTDDKILQSVKDHIALAYHPLGTAVMGPRSDGGVVDSNLKVYGEYGLFL